MEHYYSPLLLTDLAYFAISLGSKSLAFRGLGVSVDGNVFAEGVEIAHAVGSRWSAEVELLVRRMTGRWM